MRRLNPASRRAHMRGATLIEGMAAAAILAMGISGVFGGLIFASQQNAAANRLSQASAIASQVRSGLQLQGRSRLFAGAGPLSSARCAGAAETLELAGGLSTLPDACVVDLDAFETATGDPLLRVVPGYSPEESEHYRRVLVWTPAQAIDSVAVVVSFRSAGQRRYVKQFVALYNPAENGAGVEL
ncbi:type IV pilus modification PilV family protein [Myxococcus sp. NMCA1]|uniref:type IV pilus modification PilV family protein n=1 Tax=Myxococcus sp. NMCA1 TaxID=2996785 RepID=UPI002285631E|nr:prepilin cleavage protein [Myxococcus sp. NMCA1]WAM27825.1 prepilin cleavage protein [Myxococcus sp. NMCA1]